MHELVIVWTSGDRDVAAEVVMPYVTNSAKYGWWEEVRLVVWGPSVELLAGDGNLQEMLATAADAGVTLEACRACADNYGVSATLTGLGIDVKYMGEVLTGYIKEGRHVLTF